MKKLITILFGVMIMSLVSCGNMINDYTDGTVEINGGNEGGNESGNGGETTTVTAKDYEYKVNYGKTETLVIDGTPVTDVSNSKVYLRLMSSESTVIKLRYVRDTNCPTINFDIKGNNELEYYSSVPNTPINKNAIKVEINNSAKRVLVTIDYSKL